VECAPGDASELLLTLLARELPIAIGIAPLQETERAALQRIALQWWQEIRKQRNWAQM
jgi:hypothetical protein